MMIAETPAPAAIMEMIKAIIANWEIGTIARFSFIFLQHSLRCFPQKYIKN